MASLKLVGGLAFISAPSSFATSSTDSAPMLMAMRLCEPSVLMATGNGETTPLMVGFSNSSALPPPGDFISRSAISVISSSVATGWEMRLSSPALSRALTKSRKESKAIRPRDYQRPARRKRIAFTDSLDNLCDPNHCISSETRHSHRHCSLGPRDHFLAGVRRLSTSRAGLGRTSSVGMVESL